MHARNFIICLIAFLCLGSLHPAHADQINLKLQPASLQIRATPPAFIQAPITIENPGETPLDLQIVVKRFRDAGEDTGSIVYSSSDLTTESSSDTFLKNVSISEDGVATKTLSLAPKQQKKLILGIPAVKNVAPNDQYFSIIFLTMPPTGPSDTSLVLLRQGIALPVLLSLNGSNEVSASIDSYSSPLFLQTGPVPFTVKLKNSGDSFLTAKGVILITNMFGQTVGKIDVPAQNILADTTRALTNGTDLAHPQVIWKEKFLLGFYTATLTVALSPKEILYTRSIHFLAFPFSFLVGTVVTLLVAFLLIRRIKKKVSES